MKFLCLRKPLAIMAAVVLSIQFNFLFSVTVQAADPMSATLTGTYNFRTEPKTSASVIAVLPSGQTMTILDTVVGENVTGYGYFWYKISTTVGGVVRTGYIIRDVGVNILDNSFTKQLSAFPASYRTALTDLHNKHPNWTFTALRTGYDWNYVLDNQEGKNAVWYSYPISQRSASTTKVNGYGPSYNLLNDSYNCKDGSSFYFASRQTIAYYMDPRNFLSDSNIFMFETLGYGPNQTIDGIENILAGTFMSSAKTPEVTYVDTSGVKHSTGKTYAQMILAAAKYSGTSAYFIAARIRLEIGATPSGSVTGTFKFTSPDGKVTNFTGLYNFFNIYASDSPVPGQNIASGLTYARDGELNNTTNRQNYMLPWTSPERSIMGGARYIAEGYICVGQDTSYLQKFSVNPATNMFCWHQYMSSVHAPQNDSINVYNSYAKMGIVDNKIEFVIPVFENMPDSQAKLATETRSTNNYLTALSVSGGTVSPTFNYASTGTYQASVSANSSSVTITGRKASLKSSVSVGSTVRVSGSANTRDFSFAVNLVAGENNIPISITAENGSVRTYNLKVIRDTSVQNFTVTFNSGGGTAVASKTAAYNTTVTAPGNPTKAGYLFKGWYTAASGGTKIAFPYTVKANTTLYAQWTANTYTVTYNSQGGTAVASKTAAYNTTVTAPSNPTKAGYSFKGWYTAASGGTKIAFPYTVKANTTLYAQWTAFSSVTPGGVKSASAGYNSIKVSWSAVLGANGYQVYRATSSSGTYTCLTTTTSLSYTSTGLTAGKTYYYKVRAYQTKGSTKTYSKYSAVVSAKPIPATPTNLKAARASSTSVKLTWSSVSGATGYEVYRAASSSGSYTHLTTTASLSYTSTKLITGKTFYYKIRAYRTVNGTRIYSSYAAAVSAKP